jgi:hypothetical protein
MIKHVKFKKLGKLASPMFCNTEVVVDKQGKRSQTQEWASDKKKLEEQNV